MIFDGDKDKQKLAYFWENGGVYQLADADILDKTWKELKHIHYILEVKNEATQKWTMFIRKTMMDKNRFFGMKPGV